MKTLLPVLAIAAAVASTTALATSDGLYFGANLGYGKINEKAVGAAHENNNDGLAGSANVGYQFNPHLAVEGGFTLFSNEKFDSGIEGKSNYALSVAAKGILPLQNGFNVFGKVGLAGVHHQLIGTTNAGTYTRPAALVGAGVGYDVNPNWGVNAQVNATTRNGPVPAMYLVSAGLTFNINPAS